MLVAMVAEKASLEGERETETERGTQQTYRQEQREESPFQALEI